MSEPQTPMRLEPLEDLQQVAVANNILNVLRTSPGWDKSMAGQVPRAGEREEIKTILYDDTTHFDPRRPIPTGEFIAFIANNNVVVCKKWEGLKGIADGTATEVVAMAQVAAQSIVELAGPPPAEPDTEQAAADEDDGEAEIVPIEQVAVDCLEEFTEVVASDRRYDEACRLVAQARHLMPDPPDQK